VGDDGRKKIKIKNKNKNLFFGEDGKFKWEKRYLGYKKCFLPSLELVRGFQTMAGILETGRA